MFDQLHTSAMTDGLRGIWRRRKGLAVITLCVSLAIAIGVATALPSLYRSSATVMLDRNDSADTSPGEIEARLHSLGEQNLGRERLREIIERLGLYPELRRRNPIDVAIQRMRRDVQLEPREVEQPWGHAAIALRVSYTGTNPHTVARVTNDLAQFYVDEALRQGRQQAEQKASALRAQLQQLDKHRQRTERSTEPRANPQTREGDRRVGTLSSAELSRAAAVRRIDEQLRSNSERIEDLAAQKRRFIDQRDALEETNPNEPAGMVRRLVTLRAELGTSRARYGEQHPDVVRIKSEIADLSRRTQIGGEHESAAERPMRRLLDDTVAATDAQLRTLRSESDVLQTQRLAFTRDPPPPLSRVERRNVDAFRQTLVDQYRQAQIMAGLDPQLQRTPFRLLDRATPARDPVAPNRGRLLFFGIALSLVIGGLLVWTAERMDPSFHTRAELEAFTRIPVLACIPRIVTRGERTRKRLRLSFAGLATVIAVSLLLLGSWAMARHAIEIVRLLADASS